MGKLPRNSWVALLALCVAYACGSDRNFATNTGTGGEAGAGKGGSANSGGTAGKSAGGGGKSGSTGTGGGPSSGGQGGAGPGEEGGTGNVGASAGQGGEGGEIIIVPPEPGRPGMAVVAGGHLMHSARYSLVCTTGEGPGGNDLYSSPGYRLYGGVVGTTQP